MMADQNDLLSRGQAALRRERKFLRRAVAAHREVQATFNALQAVHVPAIAPAADRIARAAGFEPPGEPDPAPIEAKRPPKAPAGGAQGTPTLASLARMSPNELEGVLTDPAFTPASLSELFGVSEPREATTAQLRWKLCAVRSAQSAPLAPSTRQPAPDPHPPAAPRSLRRLLPGICAALVLGLAIARSVRSGGSE